MKNALLAVAAVGVLGCGVARADVILSGPDSNAGSYSTAALQAATTGGDSVSSGGLSGISLWGFLGGAASASPTSPTYGAITTSTPTGDNGKNAILRYYLLATGAGGAQSVVSLGEIDPSFGGTAAIPAFLADQSGGSLLSAAELVVPGAPGRDLAGVTSLQLLAVAALPTGPGGVSTAVQLSGASKNAGSYNLAALQSDFAPATETVGTDSYTGVSLWNFLSPNSNGVNQLVVTAGTDGYEVVLALGELDPADGGNPADLLPYADTGTDFPGDGVARTILPGDNKHGRWESNLSTVAVVQVPEPGTLGVLAVAGLALAAIRRRRS